MRPPPIFECIPGVTEELIQVEFHRARVTVEAHEIHQMVVGRRIRRVDQDQPLPSAPGVRVTAPGVGTQVVVRLRKTEQDIYIVGIALCRQLVARDRIAHRAAHVRLMGAQQLEPPLTQTRTVLQRLAHGLDGRLEVHTRRVAPPVLGETQMEVGERESGIGGDGAPELFGGQVVLRLPEVLEARIVLPLRDGRYVFDRLSLQIRPTLAPGDGPIDARRTAGDQRFDLSDLGCSGRTHAALGGHEIDVGL